MNDNPLNSVPMHDRVSLRAVLVREGEDASAALAAAGFVDSIAIPVVMGDKADLPGGILGDGMTPNLIAVLETEQKHGFDGSDGVQPSRTRMLDDDDQPPGTGSKTLPAAYGIQPLAPIRRT